MKKNIFILIIFLITPFQYTFIYADVSDNYYEELIDKVAMSYIGKSVPGACVIISEQGKTVFSKCYGYSDLDKKSIIKENDTYFEWGSITKTFVWVSVLQLEEEGLIDLDADIRKYLPKEFLKNLKYEETITILDLMNHTAGFEDFLVDFRYIREKDKISLKKVLSNHQPVQIFKPETVSAYSNWGAALAAYIVENVSGISFDKYVIKNIIKPLSIEDLEIEPFLEDKILEKKATGYSYHKDGFKKEDWMVLRLYPAGSLNGTPKALMKYAIELSKHNDSPSLLFDNPQTKQKLFTETWRSCGAKSGLAHGFWEYIGDNNIFGHEGGTYGFKTQLWVEPDKERAVLIATNVMETNFCSDVMASIVKVKKPKNIENLFQNDFKKIIGDYLPARGVYKNVGKIISFTQAVRIKESSDEQGIILEKVFDGKEYLYAPISENEFYCESVIPEEQYLSFYIENEKVVSMTFKLAHDYIPGKGLQSIKAIMFFTGVYLFTLIFWFITNLINIILMYKKKIKPISIQSLGTVSALLLGITGIIGLFIWMNIYTINSFQLNLIVILNIIFIVSSLYSFIKMLFIKKQTIKAGLFLLVLIFQVFSIQYFEFLNML